jgi:hypothetical protein
MCVIVLYDHLELFYQLCADVSSLLTIICGSIRLPIYYLCNKQIRDEFKLMLSKFHSSKRLKRRANIVVENETLLFHKTEERNFDNIENLVVTRLVDDSNDNVKV